MKEATQTHIKMKGKQTILTRTWLLACLLVFSHFVQAQRVSEVLITHNPANSAQFLTQGASAQVEEYNYQNFNKVPSDYPQYMDYEKLYGIVSLEIDRASLEDYTLQEQKIEIEIQAEYEIFDNPGVIHTETKTLYIDFKPGYGKKEVEITAWKIEKAIKLKATVANMTLTSAGVPYQVSTLNSFNPPLNLSTEIHAWELIDYNNFQHTSLSGPIAPQIQLNSWTPSAINSTVKISWTNHPNARYYEVQWMFIDIGAIDQFGNYSYDFRNNNTNVILDADITHYHLPTTYGIGYLFYRVRPIGYDMVLEKNIPGLWNNSTLPNSDQGTITFPLPLNSLDKEIITMSGFELGLNWSQTTTFAEDNKRKTVVSYYDGTLKNRQSVTHLDESLNETNADRQGTAVVSETVYDFLGRPAIQVLPVPSLDNSKLEHREKFNQNMQGEAYTWKDFDPNDGFCGTTRTSEMNTSSGASRYYSAQGLPLNFSINKNFIPDAQGYPFVQTEYTPDATGRVQRQSGLGPEHRLSGIDQANQPYTDNHESEMYYLKPSQEELYLLFGNDVGDASHYQKQIVIDANNQATVAYIDAHGRTIATGLIGDPNNNPNLLPIDGIKVMENAYKTITEEKKSDLYENVDLFHSESIKTLQLTQYSVSYTVNAEQWQNECLDQNLCFSCIYDLEISIKDDCGVEQIPNGPISQTIGTVDPQSPINLSCNQVAFSITPSPLVVSLPPGNYTLTKHLKVNREAYEAYKELYFANSNCIKTLDEFVEEEKDKLGYKYCNYDCKTCEEDLADVQNQLGNLDPNAPDYEEELEELTKLESYYQEWCPKFCEEPSPCTDLYRVMLQDISPSGQYAEWVSTNTGYSFPTGPNVLIENNGVLNGDWRTPQGLINGSMVNDYTFENLLILIEVKGGFPEAVNAGAYVDDQGNSWTTGTKYVKPKDLKDIKTFLQLWQPFWAESLVHLHPEYCMYESCMAVEGTYTYNQEMNKVSDATEAMNLGYFNPINAGNSLNNTVDWNLFPAASNPADRDPIVNYSFFSDFESKLNVFPQFESPTTIPPSLQDNIWKLVEKGIEEYGYYGDISDYINDDCVDEEVWLLFRGIYQSAKMLALSAYYKNNSSCTPSIPTGKIQRFHYSFEDALELTDVDGDGNPDLVLQDIIDNFDDFLDVNTSTTRESADIAVKACQNTCESYIPDWRIRLENCETKAGLNKEDPAWEAAMEVLMNQMVDICTNGCDFEHPYGSNEYKPDDPNYTNFHEAIFDVMKYEQGVCDDLLVTWPRKYNHDYLSYDDPDASTCACEYTQEYIDQKRLECPDWKPGLEPFEDCGCDIDESVSDNAGALKQNVLNKTYVPRDYRCNTCYTCDEVYATTLEFLKKKGYKYPSQDYIDYLILNNYPLPDVPDYSSETFQNLLENYLNLELGMNLTFMEYLEFLTKCMEYDPFDLDVFQDIRNERLFALTEDLESAHESDPLDMSIQKSPKAWVMEDKLVNPTSTLESLPYLTSTTLTWSDPVENKDGLLALNGSHASMYTMSTTATPAQVENIKCHCEKILNGKFNADENNLTPWTQGYTDLYPGSTPPSDDMLKYCCFLINGEAPADPDNESCSTDDYTPGQPWPSNVDQNIGSMMGNQSYGQEFSLYADDPCTDDEPSSTNVMKPLDPCGCDFFKNLLDAHGANASKELLKTSQVFMDQEAIQRIVEKCEDAMRFGKGWEDGNKDETDWTVGDVWSDASKRALSQDAFFFDLDIPCFLRCEPCIITPPPPPAVCRPHCMTILSFVQDFLENNPYPVDDYEFYSDAARVNRLYLNNLSDPQVGNWFINLENFLQAELDNFLDPSCLPYLVDMDFLMDELDDCSDPCPTLSCATSKKLLADFLATNSFPADVQNLAAEDIQILDKMFVIYNTHLHGVTIPNQPSYNMTDIENFLNGFVAYLNSELNLVGECARQVDKNWIMTMRFACPDFPEPEEADCDVCYVENSAVLDDFEDFLNRIVQGRKNEGKLDLLDKTNWHLKNPLGGTILPEYYDHDLSTLYQWHSDEGNLKYTLSEYPNPPKLSGMVKDLQNHNLQFELFFPDGSYKYHFGEIIEFEDIKLLESPLCQLPDVFEVKAWIYLPKRLAQNLLDNGVLIEPDDVEAHTDGFPGEIYFKYRITMTGKFTNYQLVNQISCFPKCLTLCNRPYYPELIARDDCEEILDELAESNAQIRYKEYIRLKEIEFENSYYKKCLEATETFETTKPYYEYHHTLYFYDQSGMLVKTVPPEGVDADRLRQNGGVDEVTARIDAAKAHKQDPANPREVPNNNLITFYQYNDLGQLAEQYTPDAGVSTFWYDNLGRLIVSQNAQQDYPYQVGGKWMVKYSYTKYDNLGRIVEVGEIEKENISSQLMTSSIALSASNYDAWLSTTGGSPSNRIDVTSTYYTESPVTPVVSGFDFKNTRNRVVTTTFEEVHDNNDMTYDHGTHYTYDFHGNVDHLLQDRPELQFVHNQQYKSIQYQFDLLSGNVHQVTYQEGELDQFIHKYTYDTENRLDEVYTSTDNVIYRKEAKYYYYLHGPLARVELGHDQVQGMDYAYTLHGWLKSVNGEGGDPERDIGQDGEVNHPNNSRFATDAFGFALHYYEGDYKSTGSFNPQDYFLSDINGSNAQQNMFDLFNGNIKAMTTVLPDASMYAASQTISMQPQMGVYRYDKLNRLKEMRVFQNYDAAQNQWQNDPNEDGTGAFYTNYSYDQNGNITELMRHGPAGILDMDHFSYRYDELMPGTGTNTSAYPMLKSNKLYHVNDDPSFTGNHNEDIDDMGTFIPDDINTAGINEAAEQNNYEYDKLGNLIKDKSEDIARIEWNAYGKIKAVIRETGYVHDKPDLEFKYGPSGSRVVKIVKPRDPVTGLLKPPSEWVKTYYTNDGLGASLSIYHHENTSVRWEEQIIYGFGRLGTYSQKLDLSNNQTDLIRSFISGNRRFEMSNHLGNVLTVVSDRKIFGDFQYDQVIDFIPEYVNFKDYYPYGMSITSRSYTSTEKYRFGFNGVELESNSGLNGLYSTEFRMLDSRLGMWLSIDPLTGKYPSQSPYLGFNANPIYFMDPLGLEGNSSSSNRNEKRAYRKAQLTAKAMNDKLGSEMYGVFRVENGYEVRKGVSTLMEEAGYFSRHASDQLDGGHLLSEAGVNGTIFIPIQKRTIWEWMADVNQQWYETLLYGGAASGDTYMKHGRGSEIVQEGGWFIFYAAGLTSVMDIGSRKIYGKDLRGNQGSVNGWDALEAIPYVKSLGRVFKLSKFTNVVKVTDKVSDGLPGGCFVAGTLIKTDSGDVAIESINVGDLVWSFNVTTGLNELKTVKTTFVRDSITRLFAIRCRKEIIYTTSEHPFYISGRWVPAKDLLVGDTLRLLTNNFIDTISSIRQIDTVVTVYNFEVSDNHSYFVSGRGVLVHNTSSLTTIKVVSELPNLGRKLDFVFGKATGSAHNIQRSTDMLRNLNRIGIQDNAAGRAYLRGHLNQTFNSTKGVLQSNGRVLRESLLMGPNGGVKVNSIWEGDRLITIMLKGG